VPTVVNLPGGFFADDELHRDAELIELGGHEEELLADASGASTAHRVTEVLSRCVSRIGSVGPITTDVARELLVGDRIYLLLRLREVTVGGRVEGTVHCPWPGCGAKADIDFATTDLPVAPCLDRRAHYTIELSSAAIAPDSGVDRPVTVTFRLPNGTDQEALEGVLAGNPAEALGMLLERCIVADPDTGRTFDASWLSAQGRFELESAIQVRAPGVDLDLSLACPECGRSFVVPFDVQDFFFGELRTSRDLLRRQVHYLAYHYHWSERDILDMSHEKRLAYIEVLAEEIEALNDAV
jgi:hypothetical protein